MKTVNTGGGKKNRSKAAMRKIKLTDDEKVILQKVIDESSSRTRNPRRQRVANRKTKKEKNKAMQEAIEDVTRGGVGC